MSSEVKIYDTTLRDGNQARGLSFSLSDKLLVTEKLIDFGVDYIEGGWPNPTNPLDVEYFQKASHFNWKHTKMVAFGSTRRPSKTAETDPILNALVAANTPVYTIFGKSWDIHVTDVIKCELAQNLEMIHSSIAFLKKNADEVIYDAEHFFDGYLANPDYAIQTLKAARDGGADCLVLCDTNGGMACTWELEKIVSQVKQELNCEIGIHTHNDTGTAVINSLSAVRGGASQVQGTINGYGERCGNANLTTIIPNLHFKMKQELSCAKNLNSLRQLSQDVDQIVNLDSDIRAPYVGDAAFAHKGGAHIDGVIKIAHSFEHLNPKDVGNDREFIISDQAGGALIVGKLQKIKSDIDKKDPAVAEILQEVKYRENQGYHFETAAGSFELLARTKLKMFIPKINIISYRVIEEHRGNGEIVSEATVKIKIDGKQYHKVADGDGPVHALDAALRLALKNSYPYLADVSLDNFKVRVLDDEEGSAARVRVWATFSDENQNWGTAGVSENIIEASWDALLDGLNYKIMKAELCLN